MIQNLFLLLVIAIFSSCSHPKPAPEKESLVPTAAFQSTDPNQETIAIVAINDFHGNLLPKDRKLPDGRVVKSGGAIALASMIKILREEMPGRVAIVDAGDEWQGTLESNQTKGQTVVDFYNRLGVGTAAIGNHEFDFGIPEMTARFKEAKYPYVASNVFEKKSKKRPHWKNVYPSTVLNVDGYKIGVIGVSTISTPGTTRFENVSHLDFKNAVKPVTVESKQLRKDGANLVLVTAHAGTSCQDNLNLKSWKTWDEATPASHCNQEEEIAQFAKGLDAGTVDGIVSGHTHQVIHHFFNHVPVVQDEAYNQFFNIIYFTFDRKTKEIVPSMTRIEGLIPICTEFFVHQSHCDVRRLGKAESPELTQAYFHGKPVQDDDEISAWLKPIEASTEKYRNEVLGVAELPLEFRRDKETSFGNLVADIYREEGKTDFAILNSGGIRTPLDAGYITYDGIYRALPFDNTLNVVKLSGKRLKLLLRIVSSGAHAIPTISGLKITIVPLSKEVGRTDLNGDGKLEEWEANRLVKVETADGKPIQDKKIYTVSMYDYLVNGGDDLSWFMKAVPKKDILSSHSEYSRDLVSQYLKRVKTVNKISAPLVDPKNPRIIFSEQFN